MAAGLGQRARVPRRAALPARRRVLRGGARQRARRRHRRHQPRDDVRSTRSRDASCCPSTRCSSSTRRTSWPTASRRWSPRSSRLPRWRSRRGGPARRAREAAARLGDAAAGLARRPGHPARRPAPRRAACGAGSAVAAVRDAARAGVGPARRAGRDAAGGGERHLARAAVGEVFDVAERLAAARAGRRPDVVWVARRAGERRGPVLHVAPLTVAGLLRARAVRGAHRGAHLGDARARRLLRRRRPALGLARPGFAGLARASTSAARSTTPASRSCTWPGTCRRPAGTGSVARRAARRAGSAGRGGGRPHAGAVLLAPGCGGGGRPTCGGASTCRCSARATTRRPRWSAHSPATRRPACSARCRLWQGVDVPGPACQLVVIDRIPFPRPDDPLQSARQEAVNAAGGNGFIPSPRRRRRCCSPRARVASSARARTAASWRCSTRAWPRPATQASCGRRCRRPGRPPIGRGCWTRCAASTPTPGRCGRWPSRARAIPGRPRVRGRQGPRSRRAGPGRRPTTRRFAPRYRQVTGSPAVADHIGCTLAQARRRCEGLGLKVP